MTLSDSDVSVIIPCLNAQATLAEAIESILAQTTRPREILLIDDASADNSVALAKSFGPIVRVFSNADGGPGSARRIGALNARGRYIAFVDADDTVAPGKHERQLAVLESGGPYTLVHTGATLFYDEPGRPSCLRAGAQAATGRCTQVVFENNPICGASTMLARGVVLELGNYDPELWGTEDLGMSLAASTCCDFVYLPEPLYHVRRHRNNLSGRKSRMAYHHWLAQEHFRIRFPQAFAALPAECIREHMVQPVLRAVREAYWTRNPDGYRRLLKLARRLAPDDPDIASLWRRRWCPLSVLKFRDNLARRKSLDLTRCPQ